MTAPILPTYKADSTPEIKKTTLRTKFCAFLLILIILGVSVFLYSTAHGNDVKAGEKAHLKMEINNSLYNYFWNSSCVDSCLDCLCDLRSGCNRDIGCRGSGKQHTICGPFQITFPYYEDCGMPGHQARENVYESYKRCTSDYECSRFCIKKYATRYDSTCTHISNMCERMTQLHVYGMHGCTIYDWAGTWPEVNSCLDKYF